MVEDSPTKVEAAEQTAASNSQTNRRDMIRYWRMIGRRTCKTAQVNMWCGSLVTVQFGSCGLGESESGPLLHHFDAFSHLFLRIWLTLCFILTNTLFRVVQKTTTIEAKG
jgi:hypothetical protein